jgi:hypothetical protein
MRFICDHGALGRGFGIVATGEEFEHPRITARASVGVEKLPIEDREQPRAHITLGAFLAPAGQGPLEAGLHQIVGAAAVAGQ